jgi:predicted NBD/HSP70 family sugar kinase
VGLRITDRHGRPAEVLGVVTSLGGEAVGEPVRRELSPEARASEEVLVEEVADLVAELRSGRDDRWGPLLGVGLSMGGHIDDGTVRLSVNTGWGMGAPRVARSGYPLADRLRRRVGCRVVVDNDVRSLAIHENLHGRPGRSSFAVVAVLADGVGGGLIINGRPWRGHGGTAGEIGHLFAGRLDDQRPCRCGRSGCIEAYATPAAIRAQLGGRRLGEAARRPHDDRAAVDAFRVGGSALGVGIASMLNWLNLGTVVLHLPPSVGEAAAGSAGSAYLGALREELDARVFSDGADIDLDVRTSSPSAMESLTVRAAASLVLERTIEDLEG